MTKELTPHSAQSGAGGGVGVRVGGAVVVVVMGMGIEKYLVNLLRIVIVGRHESDIMKYRLYSSVSVVRPECSCR